MTGACVYVGRLIPGTHVTVADFCSPNFCVARTNIILQFFQPRVQPESSWLTDDDVVKA